MESLSTSSSQWNIQKYARFTSSIQTSQSKTTSGDWEYYDSLKEKLVLTLTKTSQLILTQGFTILESHLLSQSKTWMRGVAKGDSLLILYKVKGQTRRFRLKFHSASDSKQCQQTLAKYFPVKVTDDGEDIIPAKKGTESNAQPTDSIPEQRPMLTGEVTLGEMTKVLTGLTKADLPDIYKHCTVTPDTMDTFLRICLADPTFPGFVGQVEQSLEKIIKESESS